MSGGNAQKTPYALSANKIARNRAEDRIQQTGRDWPCSVVSRKGQVVTVKFEIATGDPQITLPNITVPIDTSEYDWLPLQRGAKGVVRSADAYLGGISGLGGGTADLSARGNLSALVFHPTSDAEWTAANTDQRIINGGPDGILLTGAGGSVEISSSGITMKFGGKTVTLTSAGLIIDGILFDTHEHTLVTIGEENSGPPTSP